MSTPPASPSPGKKTAGATTSTPLKEGYIEIGLKKAVGGLKWKHMWGAVVDGAMYLYGHTQDADPKKNVALENAVVEVPSSPSSSSSPAGRQAHVHTFVVRTPDTAVHISASTEEELASWQAAVNQALGKQAAPPPAKEDLRKGRTDAIFRAKKHLSSKMASSSAGKQALKRAVNEDTRKLIDSLLLIIERHSSAKKAGEVEKALVKLIVKGFLQSEQGTISAEDIQPIDKAVRDAFNHLDKLYRYYGVRKSSQMRDGFVKAHQLMTDASRAVIRLIEPYIRAENTMMIQNTLEFVSSTEFLMGVWDDQTIEEELFVLINSMNKYTQFE